MFCGKTLHPSILAIRQPQSCRQKHLLAFMSLLLAWFVCWYRGPWVLAALFSLSLIALLFLIRIDIAFYTVIVLWMTLIAVPLPIASPFTPEENADLPFYEVLTPLMGLCLVLRIAMRKEKAPNSPLKIPMLVWFGLVVLTYFRNPIFVGDLFAGSGTGAIYHTVYAFFLCAIFYLSAASILKTEERIILTAKIVFATMVVGVLLMTFMLITGWNIPFLTGGRAPWTITTYSDKGETVFRIMAMSSYSATFFLVLLCFGSHLRKPLQLLFSLFLIVGLVLGGGRGDLVALLIALLLSFVIQPRTRWLIGSVALLAILFTLILLPNTKLPYTTRRIITFSRESSMGVGGRARMLQTSLDIIKRRPLMGYGYGRLWHHFPHLDMSKEFVSGDPHSGFLAIMTHYGVIGLGIFLWVILTAIKTGWWLYRNIEDGFLKRLMLLITLNLSASLVMCFIAAQIERSILVYLQIGVIASTYAISSGKGALADEAKGERWFSRDFQNLG